MRKANANNNSIGNYSSLMSSFKRGEISPVYLFFGTENYLIEYSINFIKDKFLNPTTTELDFTVHDCKGKIANLEISKLSQEIKTPSFMSAKRIILIKDSNILTSTAKDFQDKMQEIFTSLNNGCVVIFHESKVEKRYKKLLKEFSENGMVIEYENQSLSALQKWCAAFFAQYKINITHDAVESLVERSNREMLVLKNELDKIKLICVNRGINIVDMNLLEEVAISDLRGGIFDLTDAIATKRVDRALEIADNMQSQKESPIYIIFMIARHFRQLYVAKVLKNPNAISAQLKLGAFIARKLANQQAAFTAQEIQELYLNICDFDYKIKTGLIEQETSVKMLILEIANI